MMGFLCRMMGFLCRMMGFLCKQPSNIEGLHTMYGGLKNSDFPSGEGERGEKVGKFFSLMDIK